MATPMKADDVSLASGRPDGRALLLVAAAAYGVASPWPAESQDSIDALVIERATLDNGLRVVLNPDSTLPTVAIAVYYDVGSRDEPSGRSGFAHLFEHLMLQGSEHVGNDGLFAFVTDRGGWTNGTTNSDRTNFFSVFPAHELAAALWLEADRMRAPLLTAENLENQRAVVLEERRENYENRAYAASRLRLYEVAYQGFPSYAHATIGSVEDIEAAGLEEVRAFFDQHYGPSNAVLCIVGAFDPNEAMGLVRAYFSGIPRRGAVGFEAPASELGSGRREARVMDPNADLEAFHMAWVIPGRAEPDHRALELLGIVLGHGWSSRLYRGLVRERALLQSIEVSTEDRRGPDLFHVWAKVASDASSAEARAAVEEQVRRLASEGVRDDELRKAHNQMRTRFLFGLQRYVDRAQRLAEYELYDGDATLLQDEMDRYLEVDAEDLRRVAAEYLVPSRRTVIEIVPGEAP